MLRRIRPYISTAVDILVFKQSILPILDYTDSLIDSASKDSLSKLDRIQKRCDIYLESIKEIFEVGQQNYIEKIRGI